MGRIAQLWLLGALVAALLALGPGVASAGLTASVGALAEDVLGQGDPQSSASDDGGDDGDDDDGDDDDGGGGGGAQDRAFCAPSGPPVSGQCFAFGDGVPFDFDATSGPLGENPAGSAIIGSFGAHHFDIACLQVTGNRASLGGPVTSSGVYPPGTWIAFTVWDNTPAPDLISGLTVLPLGTTPPPNTPDCGSINLQTTIVEGGDIVVEDSIGGGGGDDDDDDGDDDDGDDDD